MTGGRAVVRFYAELNDFLPPDKRHRDIERPVGAGETVKDFLEALGVPHTEIDLIVADGVSVGFDHRLKHGDHVSVYPVFESLDISPLQRLRSAPLRVTRFALDGHLGRLARYLRLCGFDTFCRIDIDDDELAHISQTELRVLLTRDVGVLKRKIVTQGYFLRSTQPRRQLLEVVRRFHLANDMKPFTRCMACNGELTPVAKSDIVEELEPDTRRHYDDFLRCRECHRVYWKGSHYAKLMVLVEEARTEGWGGTDKPHPG